MDLAKIRKKSLQPIEEPCYGVISTPGALLQSEKGPLDVIPTVPASSPVISSCYEAPSGAVTRIAVAPVYSPVGVAEHSDSSITPLEAILAGRKAAGCDDESIFLDDDAREIISESCLEFLCFRVSDEIYGINIMDIKEIIKPREVTEVPRAPNFVSGVLSLRGTIIPIIDMRIRLGLSRESETGKERVIVIKNLHSFSGLLVDEVIQVVRVQLDAVESAPSVLDGIDRDFISGIGRSDGRLIIILHLENIADINLY